MPGIGWDGEILSLHCQVQPGANKDDFGGQHGERIKIRVQAPPVDGKANRQLIRFLARQFGVKKNQVILISGQHSRLKHIHILGPARAPAGLRELQGDK